ncbi:G-type lectin S-receptor-like serine/threonine-protein kinase At1g11300 isoform X2 [Cajanus cajan]|uniref:G-type lectin S-receptor-like serine/threonine-protein kinase At1g11300 isoform X2 n=1 Tax=Cajanus cajan TaxID=3821 RepID=UPI00098DB162|nr:G-type lectin S-receptor-like serine/threonine-protein kinase At1g11300 isoform X2 [Cajanus cajan]
MGFRHHGNLFFVLFIFCSYEFDIAIAADNITSSQSMKDPETLSSKDGNFTLGFFTPQNSTNRYVGIWWKSESTVIWVANRNQSLNDSSGVVTISEDGNLVVLNGQKQLWTTNVSNITSNTSSQFSDSGKLVLTDSTRGTILWDSFQQPSNTLLPGMKLLSNRTGMELKLTSWRSPSNPSIGSFSLGIVQRKTIVEAFIWNETRPYWRSGPWNGGVFTGTRNMAGAYLNGFQVVDDDEGGKEVYYSVPSATGFVVYILNSQGQFEQTWWDDEKKEMEVTWSSEQSDCDVYGICGPNAICNSEKSPICSCLEGFEERNKEEWNRQNWTSGCVRKRDLKCERVKEQNTSTDTKEDEFLKLQMVKVPDFAQGSTVTQDICRSQCLENCSCMAYSHHDGIGCMSWTEDLLDMQQFSSEGLDLYFRVAHSELDKGRKTTIIIIITVIIGTVILVACAYATWRISNHPVKIWLPIKSAMKRSNKTSLPLNKGVPSEDPSHKVIEELSLVKLQEMLLLDFERLATATNNFHLSNKLGQGGFGPVYKGKLQDGQEIAIKRLSRASGQGLEEFMNEVVVISKLQHRNLVRLFGCCVEDPSKSKLLDWRKRCSIIEGIARGLLYLHRDSRLRIIHRDLKTSNILLDQELNPKISDFGMARIFGGNEDQANTNRIVGTYGYMSPEYAMQGLFSEKSDVFSFGVLVLEIVSGRKNTSFYDDEHALSLLGFVWIQWNEGNILSLIDPGMYDPNHHKDILRCIHIGLLCVQEHAIERPTMSAVISMLNSEVAFLPPPSQPAFIQRQTMLNSVSSKERYSSSSVNSVSITNVSGR